MHTSNLHVTSTFLPREEGLWVSGNSGCPCNFSVNLNYYKIKALSVSIKNSPTPDVSREGSVWGTRVREAQEPPSVEARVERGLSVAAEMEKSGQRRHAENVE